MNPYKIPSGVRAVVLNESGAGSADVTSTAMDLWDSGDKEGALRLMWDDGADADWLYQFVALVTGSDRDHRLVRDLAAEEF